MKQLFSSLFQTTIVPFDISTSTSHKLTSDDESFLQTIAEAGLVEVEASEMATIKSKNNGVRIFAKQMHQDHSAVCRDLQSLAEQKSVRLPEEPSLTQKISLILLSSKEGSDFDESYTEKMGIQAHENAVELFETAAKNAEDDDIKQFAQKTLPYLKHHLAEAKALQAKIQLTQHH